MTENGEPQAQSQESNQVFASYQQHVLNNLIYVGISRHFVDTDRSHTFSLRSSSSFAQLTFYLILANSLIKGVHIIYILFDKFGILEFLDKISVVLFSLIFGIMILSYSIWFSRYPLYEVIHRSWTVENFIFERLGKPEDIKENVEKNMKATVWIHLAISWIGCFCLIVSYYSFPKYYTFTYASFEIESSILCVLLGLHEFIFMMHAWVLMTSSNSLFTIRGIVLTNIIDRMTSTIYRLNQIERKNEPSKTSILKMPGNNHNFQKDKTYRKVEEIIADYIKLTLITEEYNKWVSYKTVFLHTCGYFQFISDVFLGVQILRIPGFGVMDIWFYIEDSLASMYMIWRVYEFMSQVEPASRNFLNALKHYLRYLPNTARTKHIQKTMKTMKLLSLKIGPCPVKRSTVLSAMEILGNYYICVALW